MSLRSSGIWTALNRSLDEKKYTAHPPPTNQQKIHAVTPYFPQILDLFLNFLIDIFLHLFKLQTKFLVYHFIFFLSTPKNFYRNSKSKKKSKLHNFFLVPKKKMLIFPKKIEISQKPGATSLQRRSDQPL